MIADLNAIIEVTPWDEIWIKSSDAPVQYINDPAPFQFQVKGWLEDGQIFYGLYGPIIDGPDRYSGLICNVIVRADGTDWRIESDSQASFRVGPSQVTRDHRFDLKHPLGTIMMGYPIIGRFGGIREISIGV